MCSGSYVQAAVSILAVDTVESSWSLRLSTQLWTLVRYVDEEVVEKEEDA